VESLVFLQNFEKDDFMEKQNSSEEELREVEKELQKLDYL